MRAIGLRAIGVACSTLATAFSLAACGGDPAEPDVPAVVTISSAGSTSIASGSAVQLSATFRDTKGRLVATPLITWSSSDATVAAVASTGLVTGARAGTANITASVSGATSAIAITVTPGNPVKLVVVRQPAGAAQRSALATQPVVEIRDGAENVVTSSNAQVGVTTTVGVVSGTTTVTAQQGVARFTDLALQGAAGPRTLIFSSGVLIAANSTPVELGAGAPTAIALTSAAPRLRSGIPAGPTAVVVQLRDVDGNAVPLAGRRMTAEVTGGAGTTTLTGATAVTDALGRAVFSALTVSGVAGTAGTRRLTITADSIAAPVTTSLALSGGTPVRLVVERDLPATVELGQLLFPGPSVRLVDAFSNATDEPGIMVRASSEGATLGLSMMQSDATGRAIFSGLTFSSGAGTRTIRFSADGMTGVNSRQFTVVVPDSTPQPVSILTARSEQDSTVRNIELATMTSAFTPFLLARDVQGQPMSTAGVRWFSRDASVASVSNDGRIAGLAPGRTFIVAQASRVAVADSVLVFVPKSGTGPIVRATLPSYRVRTDTFSITFEIVPRDGRTLTSADLEIAWPGTRAGVFAPFTVTQFNELSPGVLTREIDAAQSLRVTWASTTPVRGPVQLVRLLCRVNQRNQANQVVITLNQLLQGDLTDITASTSVFNPVVVIP